MLNLLLSKVEAARPTTTKGEVKMTPAPYDAKTENDGNLHIHLWMDGDAKPVPTQARAQARDSVPPAIRARIREALQPTQVPLGGFKQLGPAPTRDAGGGEQLYRRQPDGQLVPVQKDGVALPDFVSQEVSMGASARGQQPWGAMDFNATATEQVAQNKALNEANRQYYDGDGQGHEPGRMQGYGPNSYGETGERDGDYGTHHVSPQGHDETPRRNSPPPPDRRDGSYLSPLAAEEMFEGRSPLSDADYTNGVKYWGVNPNLDVEQGVRNFGVASPNVGNPDWTRQQGTQPTRFDPQSRSGSDMTSMIRGQNGSRTSGVVQASGDAAGLRSLNNANRRRYGDSPLVSPLPAPQQQDRGHYADPESDTMTTTESGVVENSDGKVEVEDLGLHPVIK